MIADFLAHSTYIKEEISAPPPPSLTPALREKTELTHLEFGPAGIDSLKQSLVKKKCEARRAWGASSRPGG
jgi:hypothetical protein